MGLTDVLSSFFDNLFAHPYIMLGVGIFGIVFLVVPTLMLWQMKLLTGVVIAIIILVLAYFLRAIKVLDLEKYPILGPVIFILAIGGFIVGYIGEKTGTFLVTPLTEKPTPFTPPPPLLAEPTAIPQFLYANIEVVFIMILLLAGMIGALARRRS